MKKIFVLMNLGLLTGIIYFGVSLFYGSLEARLDYAPPRGPVDEQEAVRKKVVRRPVSSYKAIPDRNLFKTKDDVKKSPEPEPEEPEEEYEITKLDLALWGTVTGTRSWAFIEDKKKREQLLFEEGESVQGAIIKKIQREKVLLSLNDKVEVLELQDMASSPRGGRPGLRKPAARRATGFSKGPERGKPGGSQKVNVERAEIDSAIGNLNEIMRQAKLRPHFKNGKPDGLTLTRVKPDSIFTRLGLRSGDIITGVDGEQIQSVDDALKFYNSLKSASGVELQIRRRGRDETIQYNID